MKTKPVKLLALIIFICVIAVVVWKINKPDDFHKNNDVDESNFTFHSKEYYNIFDKNHTAELDNLATLFKASPTESQLRKLLNYPSDGEYSYHHMELVGIVFSENPSLFQKISMSLENRRERAHFHQLATLKGGVFEYDPNLKPQNFDLEISKAEHWLFKFR
jgi:hypothetical protein